MVVVMFTTPCSLVCRCLQCVEGINYFHLQGTNKISFLHYISHTSQCPLFALTSPDPPPFTTWLASPCDTIWPPTRYRVCVEANNTPDSHVTSSLLFAALCGRAFWQTADRRSRLGACTCIATLHTAQGHLNARCTAPAGSLRKCREQLTPAERPSTSGVLLNDNRVTSVRAKSRPTTRMHPVPRVRISAAGLLLPLHTFMAGTCTPVRL